jgi:hypothetical protein
LGPPNGKVETELNFFLVKYGKIVMGFGMAHVGIAQWNMEQNDISINKIILY